MLPGTRTLIQFELVLTLPLGKGLACIGWLQQGAASLHSCTLLFDDGRDLRLDLQQPPQQLHYGSLPEGRSSFVCWLPASALRQQPSLLTFNDQLGDVSPLQAGDLDALLQHRPLYDSLAAPLLGLARQQGARALLRRLETLQQERRQAEQPAGSQALARIDQAWQFGNLLLLLGQTNATPQQLQSASLPAASSTGRSSTAGNNRRKPGSSRRSPAPVLLSAALPTDKDSQALPSSRFAVLSSAAAATSHGQLQLHTQGFGALQLPYSALPAPLSELPALLQQEAALAPALLQALQPQLRSRAERQLLQQARDRLIRQQWQQADSKAKLPWLCALSVDLVQALDEAGLLVLGNFVRPAQAPFRAWLHTEGQLPLELTQELQFLPLTGNLNALRRHYPDAGSDIFFMLHLPLPSQAGALRLLQVELPGLPSLWLRLESRPLQPRGPAAARQVLEALPMSDTLWRNFKTLCDKGLGPALQWLGKDPAPRATPSVEQFGTPPAKPKVSIIVPLYGRCDFLRHQLAQFCQDPDFAEVDLIYVVDDPRLHTATLQHAGNYQPLFGIPFRVLYYPENRGFAGANNAAIPYTRAPLLLLLNSDVLPQQPGWLRTLQQALAKLPKAGMVAPLLQFPEGSTQHAGMAAIRQRGVPGLVFSHHPGKGLNWEGGDKPAAQVMLTGACLLLRKRDYEAVGGLDEHYLVGDFEDSDFSLQLRARGLRLWLVPKAKLWHLERQSQYLGDNKGHSVRDLLTLYNAWRYQRKIAAGLLPDPEALQPEA